jgi:hypothetical protein
VSFEPEVFYDASVNISGVPTIESRLRGVAFEEYIIEPKEIDWTKLGG